MERQYSLRDVCGRIWLLIVVLNSHTKSNPWTHSTLEARTSLKLFVLGRNGKTQHNRQYGSMYVDDQWFISTDEVKIVAIRRDYLQKIHKIKDPNGKKARLIITLITSNGKKLKLAGSYDNVKKFEHWYLQKDSISLNKQFEKN